MFYFVCMCVRFNTWYADQVARSLAKGQQPAEIKVDMKLTTLKPMHANWLISSVEHLRKEKTQLIQGWRKAGIADAVL